MTTTTTTTTGEAAALVVLAGTDRLRRADRELLVLAGTLGQTHVVVPAAPGDALLDALAAHAVHTVHAPEGGPGDRLSTPAVALAEAAARATGARVLLLAGTPEAKDVAARLGVRLEAGVVTDVVALDADLVATKSVLAGGWTTRCRATSPVLIATVRPNSVELPAESPAENLGEVPAGNPAKVPGEAPVENLAEVPGEDPAEDGADAPGGPPAAAPGTGPAAGQPGARRPRVRTHALEDTVPAARVVGRTELPVSGRPALGEARVVVAGGRGTGGDFGPLEELADALGGAVGASRAAVDAGWIGPEAQVGQTGRTVSPQLYVSCGISGAVQQRAGMQTARTIVAVNKDEQAPVFEIADLGIVGDLRTVLPQAVEHLRKLRGE
ncbi:electron transfer flavoprotein subunit alpha [Kocuria rosea subsp. polaris]|uniref:Electron transfer flavoprotein subunit alpha n=1 Tax=Kocuria rosea subsp. polaris TaxID=136273 RepID=A0A0W8IN69_KOCRO|nr:electron transfer flavoprotein subunit alpha/FixB family protein [Kocuria polaris]KUG61607.1 electron transfer flavoprotein subunit alpha [Kocuria polaris]